MRRYFDRMQEPDRFDAYPLPYPIQLSLSIQFAKIQLFFHTSRNYAELSYGITLFCLLGTTDLRQKPPCIEVFSQAGDIVVGNLLQAAYVHIILQIGQLHFKAKRI